MKKHLPFILPLLCLATGLGAQTFSDDIESYNVGDNIGVTSPVWGTWSGNVASEDAQATDKQAHSGTKSIELITAASTGGPTDLILPFGGQYTTGDLAFETWMFVATGRGGYFNFQTQTTAGKGWAADLYFDKAGTLQVNTNGNATTVIKGAPYPVGEWFKLNVNIDLTNNVWEVLVNDVSAGKFANALNQVASIDFFAYGPSGSLGQYYLDDVSFTYTPYVLPQKDASLYSINARTLGLTGLVIPVTGTIRNVGIDPITSFDAKIGSQTINVTGVNVASLATYAFTQSVPYTLVAGDQTISMEISNINGGSDANAANNTKSTNAKGYTAAPGKAVVVEEATGTWCQWCPRGAVFMDRMKEYYPDHFIGIAVHNSTTDPMTIPEYDSGLTGFPGFTGFPSVVVQREALMDPAAMEIPILERLVLAPPVLIENGASYDASTGELTVSVKGNFTESLDNGNDDYRFNVAITQDSMHGTTSGWAQKNAYANNAAGPMGGFELLPATVPASKMNYNHVARGILGTFSGESGSLPSSISAGDSHIFQFNYQTDALADPKHMHIVGMVLGPDGAIVNAAETTLDEAIANGLASGTNDFVLENSVSISPNPASESAAISLVLTSAAETSVRLFDQMGRLVSQRSYGSLFGQQVLPVVTGEIVGGVYTVQVVVGKEVMTRKLVVSH